jgi:hypothetical protein
VHLVGVRQSDRLRQFSDVVLETYVLQKLLEYTHCTYGFQVSHYSSQRFLVSLIRL